MCFAIKSRRREAVSVPDANYAAMISGIAICAGTCNHLKPSRGCNASPYYENAFAVPPLRCAALDLVYRCVVQLTENVHKHTHNNNMLLSTRRFLIFYRVAGTAYTLSVVEMYRPRQATRHKRCIFACRWTSSCSWYGSEKICSEHEAWNASAFCIAVSIAPPIFDSPCAKFQ